MADENKGELEPGPRAAQAGAAGQGAEAIGACLFCPFMCVRGTDGRRGWLTFPLPPTFLTYIHGSIIRWSRAAAALAAGALRGLPRAQERHGAHRVMPRGVLGVSRWRDEWIDR